MAVITSEALAKLGWGAIHAALASELVSAMGLEQLRNLSPSSQLDAVRRSLACASEMQQAIERNDALPLEDFLDLRDTLQRAAPDESWIRAGELEAIRKVCRAARRVRRTLAQEAFPTVSKLARRLTVLSDLENHIASVVNVNGEIRSDASPDLRRIRRTLRRLEDRLREKLRSILQKAVTGGHAAEARLTVRRGRMVIPLRAESKRKIRGFVHDASATGRTVYLEPAECMELGNDIRLAEAEEAREIERLLREATSHVRSDLSALESNQNLLGAVDLLHAKARLARRLKGVVPQLRQEPYLDIRDGKSPVLLLHATESKMVVPLNLQLGGELRTLVITGPNAGGKTVAMKTAGLLAIMLGCGMPIPVHPASSFGSFSCVLVEVGDDQSIEHDLSTYTARVAGLKRMCSAARAGTLLLVDEIGTGTDPAQGAALAQAVLEWFTEQGALTIVTTHHGTLKAFANDTPRVANASLSFDEITMSPTFVFRQGLPGASFAFRIAERMALKGGIIERARELFGSAGASLEKLMVTYETLNRRLRKQLNASIRPQPKPTDAKAGKSAKAAPYRRPGRAKPKPKLTLDPGQWVVVDQGKTPCQILEIDSKRAVVAFGNMRLNVGLHRLKPVKKDPPATNQRLNRQAAKSRLDVRGNRVAEALRAVDQFVDQGLGHSLINLEIIHGKGTGALREAIHERLDQLDGVSTFETPPLNPGVTYVKLA